MKEYSLDLASEQITSDKTKNYFEEVLRSYYSENYRSSVVMLYSVALTDIILKLKDLRDIYHDIASTKILSEIDALQKSDPTSPKWENELIAKVNERTNLFEPADYQNILNLQKQRHLCAHPIISQDFELYRPNKETVRALIRNTLEGLLTKPAIISRKVFDDLLSDLVTNKSILINDNDLQRFMDSKYLKRLRDSSIQQIFKSLWRVALKSTDQQASLNRDILGRALMLILNKYYVQLKPEIIANKDYLSLIDSTAIWQTAWILNAHSELYYILNDEFRIVFSRTLEQSADLTAYSWFIRKDVKLHIEYLINEFDQHSGFTHEYVSTFSISQVALVARQQYGNALANRLLIHYYSKSFNYNTADYRYDDLIKPNFGYFEIEDFVQIMTAEENNSQIRHRWGAIDTRHEIKEHLLQKSPDFDFTGYPSFQGNS